MTRLALAIAAIILALSFSILNAQEPAQLRVLVATPTGELATLDQSQQIVASFSEPMTSLAATPVDSSSGPMVFSPPIKGKYRWMGTATLVFIPSDSLPYSTGYTVTIPAGTRSLKENALTASYSWQFQTPRPRVVLSDPNNNERAIELDHSILLQFNQPVDPRKASAFISIEERSDSGKAFPEFEARHPTAEELGRLYSRRHVSTVRENSILIIPRTPFRKGAAVTLRCRAGMTGTEGPLPLRNDYVLSFRTQEVFRFLGVTNESVFEPTQSLQLKFSTPVSYRDIEHHLVVNPPAQFSSTHDDYDYSTESPSLDLELKPDQEYQGTLTAGLKDQFGAELTSDRQFTFRTGSFRPGLGMTTGYGVLESYAAHRVPITLMNIDSVRVQMAVVSQDEIVHFVQTTDFSRSASFAGHEFRVSKIWKTGIKRNAASIKPLELDEALGSSPNGFVFVQVDNLLRGDEHRMYKTLVEVTNLGITAKFSAETNLFWVTHLKDAAPVEGATVELFTDDGKLVWSGTTAADGTIRSPGWSALGLQTKSRGDWDKIGSAPPDLWAVVKKDGDCAVTSSDWNDGIEPWQFNINAAWEAHYDQQTGSLFTDRGLYKAGEEVYVKGIVRSLKEGQWRIPSNLPLRFVVKDSRDAQILTSAPGLSPFGSFAATLPLKPSAPLGEYSLSLSTARIRGNDTVWEEVATGGFRVEAFRAAEFDVQTGLTRQSYIIGDTASGFVSAKYLFGGAMSGETAEWKLSISPESWDPPGFDGYFFNPLEWISRYNEGYGYVILTSGENKLDEHGGTRVSAPLKVGSIRGTRLLMLEAGVTSPSRQQLFGRNSVVVHGCEFYLGIAPSTTFASVDSLFTIRLISVTPEGRFHGGDTVTCSVTRRIWRSVRKAESGGRYFWESQRVDTTVDSAVVISAEKPAERTFAPKEPGFYYITATSRDRRGNEILSQAYFYVTGPGYVPWERSNDDRIEIVADKQHYAPGDVARIMVKSPYEKTLALVTVEREGVLRHFTTTLIGSAPSINIPISRDDLPNIFVSVALVEGRVAGVAPTREADIGRPSFKIGYVALSVSPLERKLTVGVSTDKPDYRPGDSVTVTIHVRTAAGKATRAEVTLSVADLGVLNLIGYRLPDLFTSFYAERPLDVTTTETRIHLVQQRNYGEKGEDEGGGGAAMESRAMMDAEGVRREFRASAYWNPAIMTDENGLARVTFKLPDNLTSFKAMAVAHTLEGEFGGNDTTFVVNKPLMLQPSLPRFARVGDSFEGGAVMTNFSNAARNVEIRMNATGVDVSGDSTAARRLEPGQSAEVRFHFHAERIGQAAFIFRAESGSDRDGVRVVIPVEEENRPESAALYESSDEDRTEEKLIVPPNILADSGQIEFTAASTAMVGLSGSISYLFTYPYGCLEQRLSCILPVILAKDLVRAFHFEVYHDKDEEAVVRKTLSEIPLFQRTDGGFNYWRGSDFSWPYLSAYAMYALIEARAHGYDVDTAMMTRGFGYLRQVLQITSGDPGMEGDVGPVTRALILYDLACAGQSDFGYMEQLFASRSNLPITARVYLLRALHAANGNPAMISALASDLRNMAKVAPASAHYEERDDKYLFWTLSSNVRTTAQALQALLETQPDNPLAPRIVKWLLEQRSGGCWRTTQENLFVIDALATYFRMFEKDEPNFHLSVKLAGREVLDHLFRGRSTETASASIPLSGLAQGKPLPVVFDRSGVGRFTYGIRMTYFPTAPSQEREEGFTMTKTIEPVHGTHRAGEPYEARSVLRVTIQIATNQERHFVVLDDPLPAGFEAVNTEFQTTEGNAEESAGRTSWAFDHRELKDDRVLAFASTMRAGVHTFTYLVRVMSYGTFGLPSTRVEGMYEPEVFGQTASQVVRVE